MMNGGDGVFTVFALLPLIFYIAIIIFGVYFVIKVVKFMDSKIKLDQEKNEKIDQLIHVINKEKK
ncbi:hypothetical protein PB01_10660 [Psychrobacillus glaciei]|uniref:DUF4083 domain-containing protein n=1 Tax=Psychrobacillus glaciei TaxID=2283160 RepID=A0A5J6SP44_9BACI|nr:hypothetical protein [Psychrobacillus glaciei]QFF99253.1 hypothetical protein PB01_10660 [Psychrobacillus glaciei]